MLPGWTHRVAPWRGSVVYVVGPPSIPSAVTASKPTSVGPRRRRAVGQAHGSSALKGLGPSREHRDVPSRRGRMGTSGPVGLLHAIRV
jgi:hypothetical protein